MKGHRCKVYKALNTWIVYCIACDEFRVDYTWNDAIKDAIWHNSTKNRL